MLILSPVANVPSSGVPVPYHLCLRAMAPGVLSRRPLYSSMDRLSRYTYAGRGGYGLGIWVGFRVRVRIRGKGYGLGSRVESRD